MLDFLCVGAHKSGSSWLHANMGEHPQVWVPAAKELHFFDELEKGVMRSEKAKRLQWLARLITGFSTSADGSAAYLSSPYLRLIAETLDYHATWILYANRGPAKEAEWDAWLNRIINKLDKLLESVQPDDQERIRWALDFSTREYEARDLEWFDRLFQAGRDLSLKVGETTPSYAMLSADSFEVIKQYSPKIKLFYIMRNPIERLWSSFRFDCLTEKNAGRSAGLDDFDLQDVYDYVSKPGVARRSDYLGTLEKLLSVFGREQVLVLYFEDITLDPNALLKKVCEHLEVDYKDEYFSNPGSAQLQSKKAELPREVYEHIQKANSGMVSSMRELLGSVHPSWERDFPL